MHQDADINLHLRRKNQLNSFGTGFVGVTQPQYYENGTQIVGPHDDHTSGGTYLNTC